MTYITLSKLEEASLTAELTKELYQWTKFDISPALGSFGARTVGLITTPLAGLIDAVVHAFLFAGKALFGGFASTYNFIAKQCGSKHLAPKDLEFPSALVHMVRVVESLVRSAVLPLLIFLDPERTFCLAQEPAGGNFELLFEDYKKNFSTLEEKEKLLSETQKEIAILKTQASQEKAAKECLKNALNASKKEIDSIRQSTLNQIQEMKTQLDEKEHAIQKLQDSQSNSGEAELHALKHHQGPSVQELKTAFEKKPPEGGPKSPRPHPNTPNSEEAAVTNLPMPSTLVPHNTKN